MAKSLTVEDGLSDNRITCFYKDKKGFVWIGTRNGLNRYDGRRIIIYKPTAGNSISNEIINDIAEDSRGHIWVATMNGLNRLNQHTGRWDVFLPGEKPPANHVPSNLVWDIDVDRYDRVWIASDVREFSCYDSRTNLFTYYQWPAFARSLPGFSSGSYHSIKRFVWKNEKEIWLATNQSLVLLNIHTREFSLTAGNYRSEVHDLLYDAAQQKVYWTVEGGKLLSWDDRQKQLREEPIVPEPYPSAFYRLPSAAEKWVASENGLLRIDTGTGKFFLMRHIPQLSASLQPGSVTAVLQDDQHINWVGTSNGVSMYDIRGARSLFLPLLPASDRESLNQMGGVYFDAQHDRYFACAANAAVVFMISKRSGVIQRFSADAKGAPFSHCNTVKADHNGTIWLLTENHAYRFDEAQSQFVLFPTPNGNKAVTFRDVAQDTEGNYWLATFHDGLYHYRTAEKKFGLPQGLGFEHLPTITALHTDRHRKKVWISTFSLGFYCYDLSQKKLTTYMESKTHPHYSALDLVQDVAQDGRGNIWAATQAGGLFRFRHLANDSMEVTQFQMKTGLPDNNFLALATQGDSTLFAMSGRGIYQLSTNGQLIAALSGRQYFNFSSYLSDPRFPHKMFYNNEANELVAGVGGGLLFFPQEPPSHPDTIPLAITTIFLNGEALLPQQLPRNGEWLLSSSQNNLAVEFALLRYGGRESVELEYRLHGRDAQWIKSSSDLSAVYQNLAPGRYQFQLRAVNAQGSVAGYQQLPPFEIQPPFWQRWWAVAAAALLVAAAIFLLVRRRINNIKRKAALQQQLAELEAKALRAQMNPHFIFNSLNAIQELIVTQNVEAAYNYLSKFSKLLRLVLHNSEKSAIPMTDELNMLQLYLDLESLRFRQSFRYEIAVAPSLDAEAVLVPPLLLQPFIENALWHGLALREGEKKLRIDIRSLQTQLLCVIEDNGIGRQRSAEVKAQKLGAAHFDSKGLTLSQQRIHLLNRNGEAGYVKIEDLYDDNVATGTRVLIYLPLLHA